MIRFDPNSAGHLAAGNPARWLPAFPTTAVAGDTPDSGLVECRVCTRSLPYLADHGFHGMTVLPGAFLIALVRRIHRAFFQAEALSLRDVAFAQPVLISGENTALTVRMTKREHGEVEYEMFEATANEVRHSPAPPPCARMLVSAPSAESENRAARSSMRSSSDLPAMLTPRADFYAQLRANGNEYGPHFQTLTEIARDGAAIVAHLTDATVDGDDGSFFSPPMLDAAAQILAAFPLASGRTFILKGIAHLAFFPGGNSPPLRAIATQSARDGDALTGSVALVDASGTPLCEFSGMTLAFLDRPAPPNADSREETRLCVAATFTAEPLEDSLKFWGAHFDRPVRVDFAPYHQVFQQLLDPGSAFHGNRAGVNLLVLGLEDWGRDEHGALRLASPECFGARPRHTLPNGAEIVHLNGYETDYVYQEIFADEAYLRHGIRLEDGDTVVDIGANIGLFSLFVMSRCRNPAIFAFEPSPRVFDLLEANCAAYGDRARVRTFNCGVAEAKGRARFTFYERSSVFSSFHPDEREDRAAVEAVARNVLQNELADPGAVRPADIAALTADRLHAETIVCPLVSLSDVIRKNGIEKIHLLKIDAEKSELGILRGIEEAHWPLIEQLVIEVHDRSRVSVQTIEEQLTRRGFRCAVVEEKLLERSGLFNVFATRRAVAPTGDEEGRGLRRNTAEFCRALDSFAAAETTPLILAIAPRAPGASAVALDEAERQVLAHAARHSQIRAIGSGDILRRHPVRAWHDAHGRELGHMPFTPEGYAALGTALARALFRLGAPPVKVIALDCDHTLWRGLCAEDGPAAVELTPGFRRLQEFMLAQQRAGVLLALCSKNNEADVLAVFAQHPEMPLRPEHFAAWRINWESKSASLRALAAHLNVGLDSFVFFDDNPVECAEVRAACPEVVALQLPRADERIPSFLESVWVFDRESMTREDRARGEWYRANSERDGLRHAAPSLREFLDGLQLRVEVAEATDAQLARVAQLTLRTNQFNLTSVRRSEAEIRDFLQTGGGCLVASVHDRFGDYGLVGVILHSPRGDCCAVDTLLLSCRALGKGVEHRMIAELAGRARRAGTAFIELPFRRTDRNEPARAFLARLGEASQDAAFVLRLPAAEMAGLRYEPEERSSQPPKDSRTSSADTGHRAPAHRGNFSAAMQKLGDEFTAIDAIVRAIEADRLRNEPTRQRDDLEMAGSVNALERSLHTIWQQALGGRRIAITENFFDAGGTSLKAVLVVAMIRRELKLNVSLISLFECPTIRLLAARLGGAADPVPAATSAREAELRGRQRRNKLAMRRAG